MKVSKIISYIGIIIIAISVILLVIGVFINTRHPDTVNTYETEIETAEEITEARFFIETDLIYVFYGAGSYVNVYGTDGSFKWAAEIPTYSFAGSPHGVFSDGILYYIFSSKMYLFDASTGKLISTQEAPEIEPKDQSTSLPCSLLKLVYTDAGGNETEIVSKPSRVLFVNSSLMIPAIVIGLLIYAISFLIKDIEGGKGKSVPIDTKAKRFLTVLKCEFYFCTSFAATLIVLALFRLNIPVGIEFAALACIVALIVSFVMAARTSKKFPESEALFNKWIALEWLPIIMFAMFLIIV